MVTFDHRNPGTDESVWAASAVLDGLQQIPELPAHLLVLAAHPDDDALGAGGLIATAAVAGTDVTVVFASDGEGSHPGSPTLSPEDLARVRRQEAVRAVRALAPEARTVHLGIPDGHLRDHVHPIATEITSIAQAGRQPVTILSPWRGDGHRDHSAAARAARTAADEVGAQMLEYPIWLWHWALPSDPAVPYGSMMRLDLDDRAGEAKAAAVAMHVSQTQPLSGRHGDEAILHANMRQHFERTFEIFIAADPRRLEL